MRSLGIIYIVAAAQLFIHFSSCVRESVEKQPDSDVLVAVGDSVLTVSDVLRQIPSGLTGEDSTILFNRIVDDWVRDLVLIDVAEKNIDDMDRIEHMVESYRNSLIVNRYLAIMSDRSTPEIPESRIRSYFKANEENLILTQPLVKGVMVKVAENDESLDKLRQWMSRLSDEDVDNIEKVGLRHASSYEYFRDQWHEWSVVAEQIPYRFFDADAFVRSTKNFETAADGSVYILHITDFIPSGEKQPYDFARLKIKEILRNDDVVTGREKLKHDIYTERIKNGWLKPGLYDPLTGRIRGE